jgi:hypothetical protein
MTGRGARRHLVSLSTAGPEVPDADGGFSQAPVALSPATRYAEIKPATARDLERVAAGTVMSTNTLLVTMDFHPSVTTKTMLAWTDQAGLAHTAAVTGVNNPDLRCIELVLVAVEVVN